MNSADKIWWTKIIVALAVAGLTLTAQVSLGVGGSTSFMLGVLVYLGVSDVLAHLMGVDRMRGLRIGVGVYFSIWLMTWTLLYTAFARP
ncbi:MAG: hypothetical protein NWE79_08015 [Candidatus Bathyarchaeota archaeon]|nr:hypothetical protein [Candidatus Bathyarchaeota archaeon]